MLTGTIDGSSLLKVYGNWGEKSIRIPLTPIVIKHFDKQGQPLPQEKFVSSHNERASRIELPTRPWEGRILPVNYARIGSFKWLLQLKYSINYQRGSLNTFPG